MFDADPEEFHAYFVRMEEDARAAEDADRKRVAAERAAERKRVAAEIVQLTADLEKARSDYMTAFADGYDKGFNSARAQMLAAGEVDDG